MYQNRTSKVKGKKLIPLQKIYSAKKRIAKVVLNTPFTHAPILSRLSEANIYLKKENLQLTGAFKLRGAFNKLDSLDVEFRNRGIITASAGNHAQGVAFSANYFNIPSTIVMPESTPLLKVSGAKALGSTVILSGNNYDEAYKFALEYANEHNLTFIHPFADEEVMAGQGTIALEMLEEITNLDMVIVPVGGGGLISGVASCIKQIDPKIEIVGVSATGAPAMKESFINKKAIDSISVKTIADGIAVRDTSEMTLNHILECVDNIVDVEDEEIASAILFLLERQKLVVEGAGAVGVAALLHNKIDVKGKNVAIILSGGNIDVTMLSLIIEKGLVKSSRKLKLLVTLVDKAGSLAKLTEIFSNLSANIVQIDYDRTSTNLRYGDANVEIALETKGEEHQNEIKKELTKAGYRFKELA